MIAARGFLVTIAVHETNARYTVKITLKLYIATDMEARKEMQDLVVVIAMMDLKEHIAKPLLTIVQMPSMFKCRAKMAASARTVQQGIHANAKLVFLVPIVVLQTNVLWMVKITLKL